MSTVTLEQLNRLYDAAAYGEQPRATVADIPLLSRLAAREYCQHLALLHHGWFTCEAGDFSLCPDPLMLERLIDTQIVGTLRGLFGHEQGQLASLRILQKMTQAGELTEFGRVMLDELLEVAAEAGRQDPARPLTCH